MQINASIVIYNENRETLQKAIESFLNIPYEKELIIVDNSPKNNLQKFCNSFKNTRYLHTNKNMGFGSGHNLAFASFSKSSDLNLILNPDIYFNSIEIRQMLAWMLQNKDIALAVPEVLNTDGTKQHTIRNIPSPLTLLKRRLNIKGIFNKFVAEDSYTNHTFKEIEEIPFAHGCFFLFQSEVYAQLKGFDENFFMYMEDVDIFLRAKQFGKTVINPHYKIYHEHREGSSKNIKLLLWHIKSAVTFFNKYGWINRK